MSPAATGTNPIIALNRVDFPAPFTQENLETAFGGVLRHFVLGGSDLHDDDDSRQIRVITDDEKPFVIYGDQRRDD